MVLLNLNLIVVITGVMRRLVIIIRNISSCNLCIIQIWEYFNQLLADFFGLMITWVQRWLTSYDGTPPFLVLYFFFLFFLKIRNIIIFSKGVFLTNFNVFQIFVKMDIAMLIFLRFLHIFEFYILRWFNMI